jgi:hypothetical protein
VATNAVKVFEPLHGNEEYPMYDPHEVLRSIDEHVVPFLTMSACALIAALVWFIAAARAAVRDRVYSIPVFCSLFWLAHDSSFVIRFQKWYGTYDHWFPKLFWPAMAVTTALEIFYLWQTYRYGRSELAPNLSQRSFGGLLVAGVIFAGVLWATTKAALGDVPALGDDLFLTAFGLTIAVYPAWGIPLMIRRRSVAGQSTTMWAAYSCLVLAWWAATISFMGPAFRHWQWVTLGTLALIGGLTGLFIVRRGAISSHNIVARPAPPALSRNRSH